MTRLFAYLLAALFVGLVYVLHPPAWWAVAAMAGLLVADAVLWVLGSRRLRRATRPRYWWELCPEFREGTASPACAFCKFGPSAQRPWKLWRLGTDGVYRCSECLDVAEGTPTAFDEEPP